MFEKEAEIEFQKLPLTEREKLVSVVQAWNKAFVSGANFGFHQCAKSRLNITTISDAPIDEEQKKNDFDVLRGKILELDKHNTRLQKACHKWFMRWREAKKDAIKLIHYKTQLTKAREIILRLYNAGRDVLMCRAEEKAYDNLSNAINDKSIEQFLSEVGN